MYGNGLCRISALRKSYYQTEHTLNDNHIFNIQQKLENIQDLCTLLSSNWEIFVVLVSLLCSSCVLWLTFFSKRFSSASHYTRKSGLAKLRDVPGHFLHYIFEWRNIAAKHSKENGLHILCETERYLLNRIRLIGTVRSLLGHKHSAFGNSSLYLLLDCKGEIQLIANGCEVHTRK